MRFNRTAEQVFDDWALDYHAPGMEGEHWPSVREAFKLVPESKGSYLEVGVGNGYGLFYMASNQYAEGHCLGIDVSANMVDLTRKRVAGLENASVRHIDFMEFKPEGEPPDLIFSMEVFYYLPDVQAGIDHAYSLLAPGGRLMILVNHYLEHPESHDWPLQLDTPMALWSKADYEQALTTSGFTGISQAEFRGGRDGGSAGTLGTWGWKPA